jgi:hypothetical protein
MRAERFIMRLRSNKALDQTAMSTVCGGLANTWPAAALMAVGQLGHYQLSAKNNSSTAIFVAIKP